ncbi:hypothetical protein KNU62_gp08 [Gordonia phage Bakery]|uniref:Uncharacterized protein n=1 Tax=Gordonia phage Bakery TaxID=2591205 RepID=A0A514DGR2_9CAUD|nr:hypothetical protein KNU62_gp08 [Gordonia phage Bakery]QDH92793.1 hypothetical protein SEA_BAKERY_8 [Gordonia phage Bakery]
MKPADVSADQPWLVKCGNREWWGFRRRIQHRQSEWYLLGVTHDGVKFASDRDVELVSPLGPRRFRSLPDGYVWQDYYSPDEVIRIREGIETARDAALATIQQVRELADDLDARAEAIAEANPDHVIHIEQARQHAAMIRNALGGAS